MVVKMAEKIWSSCNTWAIKAKIHDKVTNMETINKSSREESRESTLLKKS